MLMRCSQCQAGEPFTVPCGDGIGEALMAAHLEEAHGDPGPARELRAWRARATSPAGGINELAWDSHDRHLR